MSPMLIAVIILAVGLLFHYLGSSSSKGGASTVAEWGRAMIWVGMYFVAALIIGHGLLR